MNGFSILMFIFATCVLLVGYYMYRGHKLKMVAWKAAYKGLTIEGWKKVGKWTMIASIFIYVIAIIGLFLDI